MPKAKSLDLGLLQEQFESDSKAYHTAEKALARAQEARNSAKSRRDSSDQALRTAAQAVLG